MTSPSPDQWVADLAALRAQAQKDARHTPGALHEATDPDEVATVGLANGVVDRITITTGWADKLDADPQRLGQAIMIAHAMALNESLGLETPQVDFKAQITEAEAERLLDEAVANLSAGESTPQSSTADWDAITSQVNSLVADLERAATMMTIAEATEKLEAQFARVEALQIAPQFEARTLTSANQMVRMSFLGRTLLEVDFTRAWAEKQSGNSLTMTINEVLEQVASDSPEGD